MLLYCSYLSTYMKKIASDAFLVQLYEFGFSADRIERTSERASEQVSKRASDQRRRKGEEGRKNVLALVCVDVDR